MTATNAHIPVIETENPILRGYGMWMLKHRKTGKTSGRVGMIHSDGWDEPELGWHILEGLEGLSLLGMPGHIYRHPKEAA